MSQSTERKERRAATRAGVKKGEIAPKKRNLNAQEILELQEVQRICAAYAFVANQVNANTALMPKSGFMSNRGGKEIGAEFGAVARLMEQVKRNWVQSRLVACGWPADSLCDVNLSTGEITVAKRPPAHES